MKVAYTHGLHELGNGLYAYLQPDGGWGWSNAGLVTGGGTSLLVDTLFDLSLTRAMLDSMRDLTRTDPIAQALNTHGNGDHWFGNELLPDGIPIIATAAAMDEMRAAQPPAVHRLFNELDLGPEFDAFAQRMRQFDFASITPRVANDAFTGSRDLEVGARTVRLLELGPAHTAGDAIAYVPDAGVVFTGDIVFSERTPIAWAGPLSNWVTACDRILELGASVLVPGHGAVTDASGVRDLQRYLTYVRDATRERYEAGMDEEAATDEIDISDFRDWGEPERIAVNVATAYRELDPSLPPLTPPEAFVRMARWSAKHGGR